MCGRNTRWTAVQETGPPRSRPQKNLDRVCPPCLSQTWPDAAKRWLTEQSDKKSIESDKMHLRWLCPYLNDLSLDEISKDKIENLRNVKVQTGASNATVNRMLALVRSIINRSANDWDWLEKAPFIRGLPESQKRVRWLTHEEADRLIRELPQHLVAIVRFALCTGLREQNILTIEWDQIDIVRKCAWVHADQVKNSRSLAIPLNEEALGVIRSQLGKHSKCVFTYKGRPITRANNHAWRKALLRAGIENFRFHDLRHTWASWHVQSGTPLHVLQELGGWATLQMVQRYAHLSAEHLSAYAQNAKDTNAKLQLVVCSAEKSV
jgi:integrase